MHRVQAVLGLIETAFLQRTLTPSYWLECGDDAINDLSNSSDALCSSCLTLAGGF